MSVIMEKSSLAAIAGTLQLMALILQGDAGKIGETIVSSSSCYTVHEPKDGYYWEKSKKLCEMNGSALVSIETKEELSYLKEQLTKKGLQNEYFIGLRNVNGNWTWISNSTLIYEYHKLGNSGVDCVKIYFLNMGQDSTVIFDDIDCKSERSRGYICERPVPCQDTKEDKKQEKKPATEGHPTTKPLAVTSAVHSTTTTQQQSGRGSTIPSTTPRKAIQQPTKEDSTVFTVAVSLGAALFIALVGLAVALAFLIRRKKRQGEGDNDAIKMSAVREEDEELIFNPPDRARHQTHLSEEGAYAELYTHTMMTLNTVRYESLLWFERGDTLDESSISEMLHGSGGYASQDNENSVSFLAHTLWLESDESREESPEKRKEEPLSPKYVNQISFYENV